MRGELLAKGGSKNMEIQTKQINVVIAYAEDVLSFAQIKTIDIRNKIIELWDKQPIITQFPDIIAILEPAQQLNITIQNRKVIIANNEISPFEARELDKFLQLVRSVGEILSKKIMAYGYNYTFICPISSENRDVVDSRMKEIVNFEEIGISNTNIVAGGLNVIYKDTGKRLQISVAPQFADDVNQLSSFVIQCNVHFTIDQLPVFSELYNTFKSEHDNRKFFVENLLQKKT